MATLCCLDGSLMLSFCVAIVSIKLLAAAFNASIRLVRSLLLISSSIEPEASSTITMSSGLPEIVVSDVEEIADSVVRKSDFPSLTALTVLSVQIRPMF